MDEFAIRPGHKFGCFCTKTRVHRDLTDPIKVSDELWFLFSPPFPLSSQWKEWLGRLTAEKFLESNVFIFALMPSKSIAVLDGENKSLADAVTRLFYSLLMFGVARSWEGGLIFTGANVDGEHQIRSISPLLTHFDVANSLPKEVDRRAIDDAVRLASVLKAIYGRERTYMRLRRGFSTYIEALREGYALSRLHQLARSLEAIAKPEIGKTRKQFIHRCKTFAGRSEEMERILGEIYDLRSREEHLTSIDDVLGDCGSEDERDRRICLRALQIELIAEDAFLRIMTSADLTAFFENDDSVSMFWSRSDHERYGLWGDPLDVEAAIGERSGYYMRMCRGVTDQHE